MSFKVKFGNMGHPGKIWTVSSIYGDVSKLRPIHEKIYDSFSPGDRLIYTGNYMAGKFARPIDTLNEILYFRRALLAKNGTTADDFVYLRGMQEEIWRMILQIQMSLNAKSTLEWIIQHHSPIDGLLNAYGTSLNDGLCVAREGIVSLTKWSSAIKNNMRTHPGHEKFFTSLKRAAFTENRNSNDNNLLFVPSGLDTKLALTEQEDQLWWNFENFNDMPEKYEPFRFVIRGFDPEGRGVHVGENSISLDGGGGYDSKLICAQMADNGKILDMIAI